MYQCNVNTLWIKNLSTLHVIYLSLTSVSAFTVTTPQDRPEANVSLMFLHVGPDSPAIRTYEYAPSILPTNDAYAKGYCPHVLFYSCLLFHAVYQLHVHCQFLRRTPCEKSEQSRCSHTTQTKAKSGFIPYLIVRCLCRRVYEY